MIIPRPGKIAYLELGLILLVALLTEIAMLIIVDVLHQNPNFAANIYTTLTLPIGVLLYRHRSNWKNKNLIAGLIIVSFLIFALGNLFINGLYHFNSYSETLSAVYFIVLAIAYFYLLIQELPTESITKLPMFWINAAVLIYNSGNFFIYLSGEYLITVLKDDMVDPWMFHNFFGLVFYSILWYAMLLIRSEYLKRSKQ
ncbi:MAG: hypothetical protein WDO14_10620 [Bacteroidota bacterium]